MSLKKVKNNTELDEKDPFFVLKYIAWCRSQLPPKEAKVTPQDLVEYARWAICRERQILFNDPVWERYTAEEIMIEYFAISFDNSEEQRKVFEAEMQGTQKSDFEWFEEMESKYLKTKKKNQPEDAVKLVEEGKDEFEDKF